MKPAFPIINDVRYKSSAKGCTLLARTSQPKVCLPSRWKTDRLCSDGRGMDCPARGDQKSRSWLVSPVRSRLSIFTSSTDLLTSLHLSIQKPPSCGAELGSFISFCLPARLTTISRSSSYHCWAYAFTPVCMSVSLPVGVLLLMPVSYRVDNFFSKPLFWLSTSSKSKMSTMGTWNISRPSMAVSFPNLSTHGLINGRSLSHGATTVCSSTLRWAPLTTLWKITHPFLHMAGEQGL